MKMCPAVQYYGVITNPRWRTPAILKIAKLPYLSEKSSDFDEIWQTTAELLNPMTVTWETDISLTNQLADIRCMAYGSTGMENKETKKSVVDNVVVAVLLCDYSPVYV